MNDEAESSRSPAQRHGDNDGLDMNYNHSNTILGDNVCGPNQGEGEGEEADAEYRMQIRKERRLDAKRKRIGFLEQLLRELDGLVFLELITLYYLDCSFLWFTIRAIIHGYLLTPLPDMGLTRQHDEHKAYLPMILFPFTVNFLLHLLYPVPSAGEETRGYLHGGLMIDFIGQQGPTSKWKLVALDISILLLQVAMLAVHVKKRDLRKNLSRMSAGETNTIAAETNTDATGTSTTTRNNAEAAARDQDADAEERGVLRRTDTLSDMEADPEDDEQWDVLLPSSETRHADALDMLTSGQCIVVDLTLIDTLLQSHADYNIYRQTGANASASSTASSSAPSVPSSTLRQLQAIRVRIGVGGAP